MFVSRHNDHWVHGTNQEVTGQIRKHKVLFFCPSKGHNNGFGSQTLQLLQMLSLFYLTFYVRKVFISPELNPKFLPYGGMTKKVTLIGTVTAKCLHLHCAQTHTHLQMDRTFTKEIIEKILNFYLKKQTMVYWNCACHTVNECLLNKTVWQVKCIGIIDKAIAS